jgi:tRNA threonylcarbamoyladenosine biosynthesis protein TsaE
VSKGAEGTWEFRLQSAAATQHLAQRLAGQLQAGDLLVLTGGLGAGKTTFTQGLGHGLGVRAGIISPTFVLVRIHPNLADGPNPGGPDLVHVDAYRLESAGEIDDIDLENTLDTAVTVVEWGAGRVEHLSSSRLDIELLRAVGSDGGLDTGSEAGANRGSDLGSADVGRNDAGVDHSYDREDDDVDNEDEERVLRLTAVGPRWAGVDLSFLGVE